MAFVGSQTLSPAKIFNNQKPSIRHRHRRRPTPPIFISTKLSDVNPNHVRDLCNTCNHSCHRFPNILPDGRVEPVDVDKLRIALSHSSVAVSVFARPELVTSVPEAATGGGDWYRRMIPLTPVSGQLVGFGRAVSDDTLTASICDVMVIPPLQGRGIGRMILQRIIKSVKIIQSKLFVQIFYRILMFFNNRYSLTKKSQNLFLTCEILLMEVSLGCRLLTNRGIYDIAALCSDQEMKFFKACGFGDDMLGSTTMMYTRSGNDLVVSAGRKLLMVPPVRKL